MLRWPVLGLFVSLVLASCAKPGAGMASTRVQEEGSAVLVAKNEGMLGDIRLLGPEEDSKHGLVLEFETPWEMMRPHMYLVPAGTVVFSLHVGPLNQRRHTFGFHAKAGEAYELRIDNIDAPLQVTVIETRTGRVATPRGRPKRL